MANDDLLTALWPEDQPGLRCVAALCQGARGPYWKNWFVDSTEKAKRLIERADARPEVVGVYHGCALYDPAGVQATQAADMAQKARTWSWAGRTAENVAAANALWVDVDVKPDKAGAYPDAGAAQAAIRQFALDFLPPSIIVASGGGFHLYWVFDELVGPERWQDMAARLKVFSKARGFLADPTRTADLASVLRPPGALNRKFEEPIPVRCRDSGRRYAPGELEQALGGVEIDAIPGQHPVPAHIPRADNSDLSDSMYAPSRARGVIKGCQQIRASVQRLGADDPEPLWKDVLRTLARCNDATDDLLHRVSSGHESYSVEETARKIAHVRTMAPASCESFEISNPGGCAGCPYAGREGFSPIRLGEERFAEADPPPASSSLSDYLLDTSAGDFKFDLLVDGEQATLRYQDRVKDENGRWVWSGTWTPLTSTLYRIVRIERAFDTGAHEAIYRFREPAGREFEARAPTNIINDQRATFEFLGRVGIVALPHERQKRMAHQAYNKQWLDKLKSSSTPVTYKQFGWVWDASERLDMFIGAHQYGVDGSVEPASIGGNARLLSPSVRVAGSLDEWRSVAEAFCRPGLEVQQFCLMFGLFAPIAAAAPFGERGFASVALVSTRGGQGKTTAARLATSTWMHPKIQSSQADTDKSRIEMLAAAHNLPYLLDEMTQARASELVNTIYGIGNGVTSQRLRSDATAVEQRLIRLPVFITSNASLRSSLTQELKARAEASNDRLIEIELTKDVNFERELLSTRILDKLHDNYGLAGDWWIRRMLGEEGWLDDFLAEFRSELSRFETIGKANCRFMSMSMAAAVVGARWCVRKGFLNLDAGRLESWIVSELLPEQMRQMQEISRDKLELLGEFLHTNMNSVVESTVIRPMRTVTTNGVATMVRGVERVTIASVSPEPSAFHGRTVVARWETFLNRLPNSPSTHIAETRLLVSRAALRTFLTENNCDLASFLKEADSYGAQIPYRGTDNMTPIKPSSRPLYALSKKYQENPANIDVIVFDPNKHPVLSASAAEVLERAEMMKGSVEKDLENSDVNAA